MSRTDLHRPFRGVRTLGVPETIEDRCRAYLPLLQAGHFFSHGTAALLHGIPVPSVIASDPRLHVAVLDPAQPPRARGISGHHLQPRPGSIITTVGGVPLTNEIETWNLLGALLGVEALVVAGDWLVRRGRPEPAHTLTAMQLSTAAVRRRGGERLQLAWYLIRPGTRSPMESLLRVILVAAGLPEPLVNLRLHRIDGSYLGEGDLVYPEARLVLEYEGDHHRTDVAQFRYDIRRREQFEDAGWSVVRVTSGDLFGHRAELIERVRRRLLAAGVAVNRSIRAPAYLKAKPDAPAQFAQDAEDPAPNGSETGSSAL